MTKMHGHRVGKRKSPTYSSWAEMTRSDTPEEKEIERLHVKLSALTQERAKLLALWRAAWELRETGHEIAFNSALDALGEPPK